MADMVWERTGVQRARAGSKVRLQVGTDELGRPIWGEEKTVAFAEKMTDGDEEKLRLTFTDGTKSKDWGPGSSSGFSHSNQGFIATKQADPFGRLPGQAGYTHPLGAAGLERDREDQRREEQRQDRERAAAIERELSGENDNGGGGRPSGTRSNIDFTRFDGGRMPPNDKDWTNNDEVLQSLKEFQRNMASIDRAEAGLGLDSRGNRRKLQGSPRENAVNTFIKNMVRAGARVDSITERIQVRAPEVFQNRDLMQEMFTAAQVQSTPDSGAAPTAAPGTGYWTEKAIRARAAERARQRRIQPLEFDDLGLDRALDQPIDRPLDRPLDRPFMNLGDMSNLEFDELGLDRSLDQPLDRPFMNLGDQPSQTTVGNVVHMDPLNPGPQLGSIGGDKKSDLASMGQVSGEFQNELEVVAALRNGEISREEAVAELASIMKSGTGEAELFLLNELTGTEQGSTGFEDLTVGAGPGGFGSSGLEGPSLSAEAELSQLHKGREQLFRERQAEQGLQSDFLRRRQARRFNTQSGLYEMGLGLGDIGKEESFLDFIDDAGGITADTRAGFGTGVRNQRDQLNRVAQLLAGGKVSDEDLESFRKGLSLDADRQFNLGMDMRLRDTPGALREGAKDVLARRFQNAFDIDRFGELLGNDIANPFAAFVGGENFAGESGDFDFSNQFRTGLEGITNLFGRTNLTDPQQGFIDKLSGDQNEQLRMAMAARRPDVPLALQSSWEDQAQKFFDRWQVQNRGVEGASFLPFMQANQWKFANNLLN